MRITWDLLDQLSDEYGMDINDMLNLLGDPLTDESGEDYWDYPDSDGNSTRIFWSRSSPNPLPPIPLRAVRWVNDLNSGK